MTEWIRLVLGGLLLFSGLAVFLLAIFGIFKFDFVLNRMHCASLADTLGLFLILAGLAALSGQPSVILKLLLLLIFQWTGSPIAAHMVSRLETKTDPELPKHLTASETLPKEPSETEEHA